MCGIVGILGNKPVAPLLIDALKRLEYRGYDSSGIATLEEGELSRLRAEGKLRNLEETQQQNPLNGVSGIGHTRWATHGAPTQRNAHPHMTDTVALVHNGIIENYNSLRDQLLTQGVEFQSDTDTEVVAHLVSKELEKGQTPEQSVASVLKVIEGAFALAIIFKGYDDLMIIAREGSPLAIGHGHEEMFIGSDAIALAPFTDEITYLEDGDWAVLSRTSLKIIDVNGQVVQRDKQKSLTSAFMVDKGNYRHFMSKEIHEQPEILNHTLANYIDMSAKQVRMPEFSFSLSSLDRITISACGTAFYAGLVAKYWFEQYSRVLVDIDVASEFRYREAPLSPNGLAVFISQSGETADTLASLRYCRSYEQNIVSIVNVKESSIARESDMVLPILAGPEIGVASTKAFTSQLIVLACLSIAIGKAKGHINPAREKELVNALIEVPRQISSILREEDQFETLSHQLSKAEDILYLGRGINYPIALEGALKLKEISYIHAEGYAAGELKHGPIALIDENVPVVVIAPEDSLFDKTISNMQEVAARDGKIILLTDANKDKIDCELMGLIKLPTVHEFTNPLIYAIPVQLLAYHTAVFMGTDVDQPRNLAKSVTVE